MTHPILVIGYGSTLRGDDAAGPLAAEAVAGWGRPGVVAIAVPQLNPELAEPVAQARLVVFIDACSEPSCDRARAIRIDPDHARDEPGHTCDPRALLALARAVYGTCPEACLVLAPSHSFTLGASLSARAMQGLDQALRIVAAILDTEARSSGVPIAHADAGWPVAGS